MKQEAFPVYEENLKEDSQSGVHEIRKRFYARYISLDNNHGTILNRNKGNSGRKRTQRKPGYIAAVKTSSKKITNHQFDGINPTFTAAVFIEF